MRLAELAGKRVAIWGYGREGRAALNLLRQRFPQQRFTLLCTSAEAAAAHALADANLDVLVHAAESNALLQFEVMIKSPGISPYQPAVHDALEAGVRFTSGSAIWFAENPHARTICITGTKGKSTVSALIAHLLRSAGKTVALAGNIGLPLLELMDVKTSIDWWVIELSSFQTRDAQAVPDVLLVNNLYPEHLDWHGSIETYYADKLALAARAKHLVIGAQQPELAAYCDQHPARTFFGTSSGWHVTDAAIWRGDKRVFDLSASPLPGAHNAQNLCAAFAMLEAAGEDAVTFAPFIASFQPLPHRLQTLGVRDGITYVNDSIATTPYATLEALHSFPARAVTLLVGGFDRGVSWEDFALHMQVAPPHTIITMGANGARIAASLRAHAVTCEIVETVTLEAVIAVAKTRTPVDGVVLLSPGAPSFDQFRDYAERGREFARLAGFDPQLISGIAGLGIA
ncbi:UDP-N-acetylmuramoyl-L-alanine--D-glutamate ligase [Pseudolysobacter antarcticus]|uniref:UDP-N-acetylmuramoylalanine--D-glutamate ligase n=1 Tax=Pseudolysobacter antarcticus TaxID=2511995 RepID=A0A411HGS5_9GAMM|nr:UDP-N-acetylmuramoyl-L-alanine--D-glutamate ligase [Pseudolysobacter antarcticus]QBB69698.1 UDP-N-acetylmuramoyl-L-alanine--D-glutamate ligase [Pseudolysobacter antarcticus]